MERERIQLGEEEDDDVSRRRCSEGNERKLNLVSLPLAFSCFVWLVVVGNEEVGRQIHH